MDETAWCPARLDAYLNRWFSDYGKARDARDREGGYLLPYKKRFFVCQVDLVRRYFRRDFARKGAPTWAARTMPRARSAGFRMRR